MEMIVTEPKYFIGTHNRKDDVLASDCIKIGMYRILRQFKDDKDLGPKISYLDVVRYMTKDCQEQASFREKATGYNSIYEDLMQHRLNPIFVNHYNDLAKKQGHPFIKEDRKIIIDK
ncbi:MAG: hypothetical protein BGO27_00440 [Alphaproteobacteria bacterium 33-17]|nr:MAG: hypothetical protein BGO27_00440 [Alphaproteobacteria bacterium 33-17]